jgi:hypothetical protein
MEVISVICIEVTRLKKKGMGMPSSQQIHLPLQRPLVYRCNRMQNQNIKDNFKNSATQ